MTTVARPTTVKDYFDLKQEQSKLEKKIKPINDSFKKMMVDGSMKEFIEGDYKLTLGEQDRSTMDDARLVKLLKGKGLTSALRMIEIPVTEEVERIVCEGIITPEEFAECIIPKKVLVLSVKKEG